MLSVVVCHAAAQDSIAVPVDSVGSDTLVVMPIQRLKDGTRVYSDSAIYQGMNIKLDLFNSIYEPARSKGKNQSYEIGMSWRLKQRYYPTLELGYAQADKATDTTRCIGQGAFARVGVDINGLKKHPEHLNALLVGIRIATALQQFTSSESEIAQPSRVRADAWGEVCAGCQVQVWEGLQMGWTVRFKILMTRTDRNNHPLPAYIPGFGSRNDTNWGLNYYIGYHF